MGIPVVIQKPHIFRIKARKQTANRILCYNNLLAFVKMYIFATYKRWRIGESPKSV